MTYLERIKVLSDEKFHWRIVKRGKDVVSMCSSFLTIGTLAISLLCGGISDSQAGPTGGQITSGTGSISQRNMTTTIDQESSRLDIDWRDFSSNVGDTITFNQPTSEAIAINRVTSGIPSNLRGELNANGRVFILNNAGVTFHKGSQTNVGSLIATTAKEIDIDDDGIAHFSDSGNAAIINEGDIIVSEGGFAVLVAPQVANHGFIRADLGRIEMGSATEFTFDLRGDGTIVYKLTEEELENAGLSNTGILQAKSGVVNLSANVASDIRKAVVNLDGLIDADSFGEGMDGGTILVSSKGDINMNGTAKGEEVRIVADATMNFNEGAEIEGGFAEVSGRENILFRGATKVDKLLIDPATMLIKDGSGVAGVNEIYEADIEALSQGGTDVVIEATDSIIMENLTDDELTGGSGNIELFGGVAGVPDADTAISFTDLNDTIRTTSGDIIMDAGSGGINVGNLVTGGVAEVAPGSIELTTINGGNISTGSITIEGAGSGTGASLLAPFSVEAFASLVSDGDITINGNVDLSADADVLAGGYGEAYSLLDLRANATGGTTTVNGDVTVDASANGNDAAVVLSHSIVGIKSYDTNITGSLNQSSSLTGTYTQQADNYLYTLVNEGRSVYSPGSKYSPDYDFAAYIDDGRTDFQPITHTSISYTNTSSRDVTIGGAINAASTNTSIGAESTDFTLASLHADNGTLTVGGAMNVSVDTDINTGIDLEYQQGVNYSIYAENIVLGDVNFTTDMDVADTTSGDIDAYIKNDIFFEADQDISMGAYDAGFNYNIGASSSTLNDMDITIKTDIIADDLLIDGSFTQIADMDSISSGDNAVYLLQDVEFGESSVESDMTVNGDMIVNIDVDLLNSLDYASLYHAVTQYVTNFTATGDVDVHAIVDVENSSEYSYTDAVTEYTFGYSGTTATYNANSVSSLATVHTEDGDNWAYSHFWVYDQNDGDITINITEGIDVISEYQASGDIEAYFGDAFLMLNGSGNSVVNADYLNLAQYVNTNGYSVSSYLGNMYTYIEFVGLDANITNDITASNEIYANGEGSYSYIDLYLREASIDANDLILDGSHVSTTSSEGTGMELEFTTYNAEYINLTGDFVINQSITSADTYSYEHEITGEIDLDLSGDFTANSILVDSEIAGGSEDETVLDFSEFDIDAQNITITNGIDADVDIDSATTSDGDLDLDIVLTAVDDVVIGGVSTVAAHNNTEEGTSLSNLEVYANGIVDLGDVTVASSQYAYLYVENLGGGNIDTGSLGIDIDGGLSEYDDSFWWSIERKTYGEITLVAEDITIDGDINMELDIDYGTYVSTLGERGSNELYFYAEGDTFTTTGNVTVDSSVSNIAGDFYAWADSYFDIGVTGDVSIGDITLRAYSEYENNGEAFADVGLWIYPSTGSITIGDIILDVDAEGTGYTDYNGAIIDVWMESESSYITIGNITTTVDVPTTDAGYSENLDWLYLMADGNITVENVTQTNNLASGEQIYNLVDNYFESYNGDVTVGDFNVSSTLTTDSTDYYETENYAYFIAEGDITLGEFSQTTTGSMTASTPFAGDYINAYDEISLTSNTGSITTGDFTVSSIVDAGNANTANSNAEADIDLLAEVNITTGAITVEEDIDVNSASTSEYATVDLLLETTTGDITVNGSVDISATAEQGTLTDPLQIMEASSTAIFNAANNVSVDGDFVSHAYNIVAGGNADLATQSIAWMMSGYGSGYDLASDHAAGALAYFLQYTDNKVLGDATTATLNGNLEVLADAVGTTNESVATGAIISSSDEISFGSGTQVVVANGGSVEQRISGQDVDGADIATLILLDTDTETPDDPPIIIEPEPIIPTHYDFSDGYSYPKMRTEYVFFDFDKDELDEEAMKKLERIYNEYASSGISKLFIEGHTDLSGSPDYNDNLADRRAASTSEMLHALGLDKALHSIRTLGEEFPYVPTKDGVAIRENRRVKIKYLALN